MELNVVKSIIKLVNPLTKYISLNKRVILIPIRSSFEGKITIIYIFLIIASTRKI